MIETDFLLRKRYSKKFWTKEIVIQCIIALNNAQIPFHAHSLSNDTTFPTAKIIYSVIQRWATARAVVLAARRQFGSWKLALIAAHLDPTLLRPSRHSFWTKNLIIDALKNGGQKGYLLNSSSVKNNGGIFYEHNGEKISGKQLFIVSKKIFGSWDNVLREAKFNPYQIRITSIIIGNNRLKTIKTLKLLKKFNIPLNHASVYSKSKLIKQLTCLHLQEVISGRSLLVAAKTTFGSWDKGLTAAGLDVCQIRLTGICHRYANDKIIELILFIHDLNIPLNSTSVYRTHSRLIKYFACKFMALPLSGLSLVRAAKIKMKSWDEALRASGFNPYEIRLRLPYRMSNLPIIPHQIERIKMQDGSTQKITYMGAPPKPADEIIEEKRMSHNLNLALLQLNNDDQILAEEIFDIILNMKNFSYSESSFNEIQYKIKNHVKKEKIYRILNTLKQAPPLQEYRKNSTNTLE